MTHRGEILKGLLLTYLLGECELSMSQFDGLLGELRAEVREEWLTELMQRLQARPKRSPPKKPEDPQYPMQYGFKGSKKKPKLPNFADYAWKKLRDA